MLGAGEPIRGLLFICVRGARLESATSPMITAGCLDWFRKKFYVADSITVSKMQVLIFKFILHTIAERKTADASS